MNHPVLIHEPSRERWLAFENPLQVFSTSNPAEVVPLLREIEFAVNKQKLYAAGFVSYEAAPAFDPALTVHQDSGAFPLLWFGLYRDPGLWAPDEPVPHPAGPALNWTASLNREAYAEVMARLKQYLYDGETYQVNYTLRLASPCTKDPLSLFRDLIRAQGAHYSAFIDIGNFAICSASPELFFHLNGTHLESRPMKGTMPRGLTAQADRLNAQALQDSPKNRAENVMIVDMIRNDMGRVAEKGSVSVDQLFKIERYPTVWQMVSTVSSLTKVSLCEIFTALFPCASITGAPKAKTMSLITREETLPRRIYTGSIGYMAPDRQAQFNVAIRTVLIDKTIQTAEYGVGGGIVWDSVSGDEYDECLTKAQVLSAPTTEFQLLETILWTPDGGFFLLERHLDRLAESAGYFDFILSREKVQHELLAMALSQTTRIRLLASQSGKITLESFPFDPTAANSPALIRLAENPIDSSDRFLYHKTTRRQVYESAKSRAKACDDVLLWNAKGELTESTIANVVVELDGKRLTPPVSCGLLAGTFRSELLAQEEIQEGIIHLADLPRIRKLFLINSLRKWREAKLVQSVQA